MKATLAALCLGAFAIGVTEFAPMGLLPSIAEGLQVSIPTAGMLISAYAIGVMVGAPIITLALSPLRRRTALIGLMCLFVVGNIFSALAPSYALLVVGRVVTSLAHGAFFGIGAMVAADLVAPEKRASAVATMFMGLTIANIGGVPASTWLGNALGWRLAFGAIAVAGGLAVIALRLALPAGNRGAVPDVKRELRVLTRPAVLLALSTTVFGAGAMFTLYTYVAPMLQQLTHASTTFVTAMLVVIGIGFTIGNVASGRLADRSVLGTLLGFLLALAVFSFVFPAIATQHAAAAAGLLLWGAAAFGVVAPTQMRVMQEAHEAQGLASSVNIGAFNLGNALGAAAGGGVLSAGLGYTWIAPMGGLLALIAAGLALANQRRSGTKVASA
jgi:MFS transporter, DHA1 family, inner membrane transport protein